MRPRAAFPTVTATSTSHFKTLLRGGAVIGNSNPCEFYARKFRSRIVHGNLELLQNLTSP